MFGLGADDESLLRKHSVALMNENLQVEVTLTLIEPLLSSTFKHEHRRDGARRSP